MLISTCTSTHHVENLFAFRTLDCDRKGRDDWEASPVITDNVYIFFPLKTQWSVFNRLNIVSLLDLRRGVAFAPRVFIFYSFGCRLVAKLAISLGE